MHLQVGLGRSSITLLMYKVRKCKKARLRKFLMEGSPVVVIRYFLGFLVFFSIFSIFCIFGILWPRILGQRVRISRDWVEPGSKGAKNAKNAKNAHK